MGRSGALAAVAAALFAATAAQAATPTVLGERPALAPELLLLKPMAATGEQRFGVRLSDALMLEARARLFSRSLPGEVGEPLTARGLVLGYSLGDAQARVQLRAGYRYGLPSEAEPAHEDAGLVLTSGGSVAVSAGTVAWLQLDLDGFREVAGRRFMRLDAVPGLRFRLGDETPWEAGFGVLASLRPTSRDRFGIDRFAGLLQLSGRL